jgi:hypothetical protein
MELFRPDQDNTYNLGVAVSKVGDEVKITGSNPGAKSQYFQTESGTVYAIFFNLLQTPPVIEVNFGAMRPKGLINYDKSPTQGTQQVVKIFNTVVKAILDYDQAHGGTQVWIFSSAGASRTRMYNRLAQRVAQQIGAKVHSVVEWGHTFFYVYRDLPGGIHSFLANVHGDSSEI